MLLMTPAQILFAVRRALEENIMPELQRDYARVQLLSAIVAIKELESRFEEGDPCIAENERYVASLKDLIASTEKDSPALSTALVAVLKDVGDIEDAREKNRVLKEGFYRIVSESPDEDAVKLLQMVAQNIEASFEGDQQWLCLEALASLHG